VRIGITIKKTTGFRGVFQEFHNTYFRELETAVTAPANDLIDETVAIEKAMHSTAVNFVHASVWEAGGTPAQNSMLFQKMLTGTGARTHNNIDPERAVLIQWPAGFDSLGRPVFLRKWYHSMAGLVAAVSISANVLAQQAPFTDSERSQQAAKADELRTIGSFGLWQLCSKTGREAEGAATCHKYLEHHQLGDMWR
jgi:hypothetical protein